MSANYEYIPDLEGLIPEAPPESIISRTLFEDDRVKTILFAFAEGQELSEHTASQPAMLHFLRGEAELTLGQESMAARRGTWVHMPPRLEHSIVAKRPVLMLLLLFQEPS
jgi:quercetin dioxygenase-like cupin family protein